MKKEFYVLVNENGTANKPVDQESIYRANLNNMQGSELLFESEAEAKAELDKHVTTCRKVDKYHYNIDRYYVAKELYEVDEDGDREWLEEIPSDWILAKVEI